jgi:hypothetical protein
MKIIEKIKKIFALIKKRFFAKNILVEENHNAPKSLKERQTEFLNDTILHYNLKNRATRLNGRCIYSPIEGVSDGCAIGRHIVDKELCEELDKESKSISSLMGIYPDILPKHIYELGSYFLRRIQILHDSESSWTLEGISESGIYKAEKIRQDIIDGFY